MYIILEKPHMFLAFQPLDFIMNNTGLFMTVLFDNHPNPVFNAEPIGLTL
tara:strand:+ start:330 stop:479 length:150 start_codon:yes stop_codon:yes gene_type:complete